jgi:uncharacterized protein YdaU (DUF1376 family)
MSNVKEKGKDPAVLFYTKDFLVSTFTLTYEQKGKYITLLCLQHQHGKLSKKDLQSVLTEEDWEIADKFEIAEDGFYYNKRMAEETFKRANFVDSRRSNGSNGGRPKGSIKTEKKPNGLPNGNLMAKLKESYDKPKENLPGNANANAIATVNVNQDAIINADVNDNVSNSTRNIIDKALDTLIQYDIHPEQYEIALQSIVDVGGLDAALDMMGYEDSIKERWSSKILQVSNAY